MLKFLQKIIEYFNQTGIEYMLSGSVAMSIYTLPRATRDFDFVVHLQPKDIDGFANHFSGEYYCDADAIKDAIEHQSLFNVIDHSSGFKADFVILKNAEYRQTEFKRRQKTEIEGISVYVVSPEDLLISKLIWIQGYQSGIQKDDIINLWELSTLDRDYINNWIKSLNLNTFNLLNE